MKFYVLRHGQTEVNVKKQINGRNDIGLTEEGIKEAKEAGERIKDIKIDLVFCSPLKRAIETCDYANVNKVETILDERLIERQSGSMEFESLSNLDYNLWFSRTPDTVYGDAEGYKFVIERVTSFIEEVKRKYKDKNILVITHGDVCRAFYVYFNPGVQDDEKVVHRSKNCELTIYEC